MAEAAEVVILGAGPVGCALALALAHDGRSVTVLERRPAGAPLSAAFRPIALSHASRLILERIGAWDALAATAIERIHVSQAGAFGRTLLGAADARVPALGHVIGYDALAQALAARVEARGVRILRGAALLRSEPQADGLRLACTVEGAARTLAARCVVHAEGSSGSAREKSYGFDAVVGLVAAEPRARGTAYERFTAEGPLALLPVPEGYGVVWSARPARAARLAAAPAKEFIAELAGALGARAGRFDSVRARGVHPLVLRAREARVGVREAFIGNAAQTLHPVAGQGLNLGLRDAWALANAWREADDPGAAAVLERYARSRRLDAAAAIRITDLLAGAFTGGNPLAGALRGLGLTVLDILPPARRFFARRMIYGASAG